MMKYNGLLLLAAGLILAAFVQGCGPKNNAADADSISSGTATFLADESCAPIVDEELYVFKQQNPEAKPKMMYSSENQVVGLLLNDKVRFVVLARNLTKNEAAELKRRRLVSEVNKFAVDAVTIIVNQASNDTTITVGDIKKMLTGQTKTDKNIVFDNPNSSSVRYLTELTGTKELKQKNIYSLQSDKEVIKYVSNNPNAIGITGFSWLNDPDPDYADAVKKVKIVRVRDENSKEYPSQYFTPSQTTLALKQYPLIRSLYMINNTGKQGLAEGFAHFVMTPNGQRIILRSGLLPASIPEREINIKYGLK